MRPGPIYFKTPSKCGIFGITNDAIPRQVNHLIEEAVDVGKGANSTISYVHQHFANHGLGHTLIYMQTTVQDRTKITTFYGSSLGEQ